MEAKESKLNKEICFLIAKFLQNLYPEIGQMFIRECEKNQLFPSSIFIDSTSYNQLSTSIYPTIPSSQLMDLLMSASKKFHDPSFLRPLIYKKMPIKQIVKSFQPVKRIIGHIFIVYCLSIDKTSQILITGSDDSLVKVWKLPELSLINSYVDHNDVITNIDIHPSNLYFASSSADGVICVFSLITGILKFKTKFPSEINDLRFSQCGKYLSISTKENGLFLYIFEDFLQNKPEYRKWSNSLNNKEMWWVQFTPSSTFMIFVTATNDIYAYLISSKRTKFLFHSDKEITSLNLNHKIPFKIIFTVSHSSYFYVLMNSDYYGSFFSKKIKIDLGSDQQIIDVNWNCDESFIIALTKNSGIYAWNAEFLTLTYHIDNSRYLRKCRRLSISPVMPFYVFVSNKDYVCSFWDLSMSPVNKSNSNLSSSDQNLPLDNIDSSDYESSDEEGNAVENNETENGNRNNNNNDNNNDDDNNNANASQFNYISIAKDQIDIEPISSYTVYFKIESICWSPNGEFIICSDNLQGFTLFISKTGPINIQTEHQFLLKEKSKYVNAQMLFERRIEAESLGQGEIDSESQQQREEEEEVNNGSNNGQLAFSAIDDDQNILVDAELNPLLPRPKRWKLHQINLRIKKNEVPEDIIKFESSLARIFKK